MSAARYLPLLVGLALVSACAEPTGTVLREPPAPVPPVRAFASAGRWTVNRIEAPGGYFCAATTNAGGPRLAITGTFTGLVGLDAPDVGGQARAGGTYAMDVRFDGRPPLTLDAGVNAPGRLVTLPPAPDVEAALVRGLSAARTVSLAARPFGPLGDWDLSGSAQALDALRRCAQAG